MATDPVGEFASQVRTDIADALDAVVAQKAADGVSDQFAGLAAEGYRSSAAEVAALAGRLSDDEAAGSGDVTEDGVQSGSNARPLNPERPALREGPNKTDQIMRYSREYAAWQARAYALVLERAGLSPDALETARCVLRKLALVELDDLTDAEFRAEANNFVQDANHLEISLFRAHYRNRIRSAEEPRDPDSPR